MKINKIFKSALALAVVFTSVQDVFAQQDPQFTQYMYNPTVINPAYAGTTGNLGIFGQYRTQWVGLDGAPQTATVSVTSPLGESNLGLGVTFVNDRLGAMDNNNISVDLSYTIDLNYEYKLAFGIKGTANMFSVDYTKTLAEDSSSLLYTSVKNKFSPNIGAGLYLYNEKSYLGLSVPNFLTQDRYDDNSTGERIFEDRMHFFLMGGYVFDLNDNVKFKPAFLAKAVQGAPLQLDLTANFMLKEKFTIGAAYRWDASISGLVGFQANKNLFIGYSYDADTTTLSRYGSGSHEIFLKFELFNYRKRVNTPRFF